MKQSASKTLTRFFLGLFLVMSTHYLAAQGVTTRPVRKIFERDRTYEHQILQVLKFNPLNAAVAFNEAPKTYAQLHPLERAFGRLALEAAEIFALDIAPDGDAATLLRKLSEVPYYRHQFNGILALLVTREARKNSMDLNTLIIQGWTAEVFKSTKIRAAKAILDEYEKWERDWCAYEKISSSQCEAIKGSILNAYGARSAPKELITKYGMQAMYSHEANMVALATGLALTGVLAATTTAVLGSAIGVTTAAGLTTSILGTFGGAAGMASVGAAGMAGIAGGPAVAFFMACVVGGIEMNRVIEETKFKPMLKMKLGQAITENINIKNELNDSVNRSMFFLAFQDAALKNYKVTPALVDGEVRFYCQAGFVSSFELSYSRDVDPTPVRTEMKSFTETAKDLTVGNEKSFSIPRDATNISVKGWYLAGDFKWKELINDKLPKPTYKCYTSYGTIFEAKYKNDCPEVNSITGATRQIAFTQGGGYNAWYRLTWDQPGLNPSRVQKEEKSFTVGRRETFNIPAHAKNVSLTIWCESGQIWNPWITVFEKTWPEPPNFCIKTFGAAWEPKWNNECY